MIAPAYQPVLKTDIDKSVSPLYVYTSNETACAASPLEEGNVRVIAGNFNGVKGAASTHTQVDMWDITIVTMNKEFEFETVKVSGNGAGTQIKGERWRKRSEYWEKGFGGNERITLTPCVPRT